MKQEVKKTYSKLHKLLESYYNSNSITKTGMANNRAQKTGYRVLSLGNNSSFDNFNIKNRSQKLIGKRIKRMTLTNDSAYKTNIHI